MAGKGKHIYMTSFYIHRHMTCGLNCIHMERNIIGFTKGSNVFDGIDSSQLIIDPHNGHSTNNTMVLIQFCFQVFQVYCAGNVYFYEDWTGISSRDNAFFYRF